MVKILNILQKGTVISCNYCPENSDNKGYIEFDINSQEVVSVQYSDYPYGKSFYISNVVMKLNELLKTKQKMPKETYAVCY